MSEVRSQRVIHLFESASELDASDRSSFLRDACAGDESLRAEVESLLRADETAGDFLMCPAIERAAPAATNGSAASQFALGRRIGAFRIEAVIGVGGMGTVYRAVQDRPRREVALKVLRTSVTSKGVLRRFEYEAELLARLEHAGIARVYDAGTISEAGVHTPYFAMEYVAGGLPVTRHVQSYDLDLRARLELIAQACDAVHHAHLRGVIHRDLKPDNILVDPTGRPKIIDFGVARANGIDFAVSAARTSAGQLIGTLQYMSPEQLDAKPDAVDVRSDVYSLGLVLYELLCGKRPYDLSNTSLSETMRLVRDIAPPPASSIDRMLSGDVETIIARAIEKEPDRRYQSAAELAGDIRRFLAGEPIRARPASMLYQLRLLAKRHRPATALLATLALAIIAFSVGMSVMYARATEAEEQARAESEAAHEAADSLIQVFRSFNPLINADDFFEGALTTDDLLRRVDEVIAMQSGAHPLLEARLARELGTVYLTRDDDVRAEQLLRRSLELRRQELGDEHLDVADSLHMLALVLVEMNAPAEAEEVARKALNIRRRLLGPYHSDTLYALCTQAHAVQKQHDGAGVNLLEESLPRLREEHNATDSSVAMVLFHLGSLHHLAGEPEQAEPHLREAVAINRERDNEIRRIQMTWRWTQVLGLLNRSDEAERELRRLLREAIEQRGEDHPHTATTREALGTSLHVQGKHVEAIPYFEMAMETRRRKLGEEHRLTLRSRFGLGQALRDAGENARSETILRRGVEIARTLDADAASILIEGLHLLANTVAQRGRFEEEIEVRLELLTALRSEPDDPQERIADESERAAITLHYALGDSARAKRLLREAILIREKLAHDDLDRLTTTGPIMHLGQALSALDDSLELEELIESATVLREIALTLPDAHHARSGTALSLGVLHRGLNELDVAESYFREAVDHRRRHFGVAHRLTGFAECELGRCLFLQGRHEEAAGLLQQGFDHMSHGYSPQHPYLITALHRLSDLDAD